MPELAPLGLRVGGAAPAAPRRLPPFFALRAVEAAARHRSYSRAAEELSVTHGAVSQQIRRLETELRARLFERRGNHMIPTLEAQRLAEAIGRGLDVLQGAVAEFASAGERGPLVISVEPAFATRWLAARLPRLLAHPAGAGLEVRVEDRRTDLLADGVDLAVRYGEDAGEGLDAAPLDAETLFPVCSPQLAARLGLHTAADLRDAPLLHHAGEPWSLWFEGLGLSQPTGGGLVFADSLLLYEAAAQGLGVALARSSLVQGDLASRRLVRPTPGEIDAAAGYSLVWRTRSRRLPRIAALREWLIAEARRSTVSSRAA